MNKVLLKKTKKLSLISLIFACVSFAVGCSQEDNTDDLVYMSIVHNYADLNVKLKMKVDDEGEIIINKRNTIVQIENLNSMAVNYFTTKFTLVDDNGNIIEEVICKDWSCSGRSTKDIEVDLSSFYDKEGEVKIEAYGGYITEVNSTSNSGSNSNSSSSTTPSYSSISDEEAWSYAQYCVKNSLKSPKSADFPWINEATIVRKDGTIAISSYVDAENSYGANIRTAFIVTLDNNGDLIDVDFIE